MGTQWNVPDWPSQWSDLNSTDHVSTAEDQTESKRRKK